MSYDARYGLWKTIKDGAAGAVALGCGALTVVLVQFVAQCPDLTVTLGASGGVTLSVKAIIQFMNNWRKNRLR